jgi:tetratricopeptide (TPR) repeat protein
MNEIQLSRYLDQARSFVEEGKHLHAIQVYRRLISGAPGFAKAYLELASLYEELDRYPVAEQTLHDALERCGRTTEIIRRLGDLHLRCGQYERAISFYQSIESARLPHVQFNLGIAYFYIGNHSRAEHHLRLTLKYDPHFPRIYETIADLLIRRRAFSEAVKYLRKGINIDPYSSLSHYLLGLAYFGLYDYANAYDEFVMAIEMDPKEVRAWEKCGETLVKLDRPDEAEAYLKKALELDPRLADTFATLGYLSLQKGKPDEAMDFFTQALQLQPDHARAIEGRVQVKVLKKKEARA